ncbi:Uncharacterised protein [Klebsiella pneumoniae subsp. rhinoscleromatis]|nr:Uncharacterised protein [Klebsiella pneumoniae subsp. rhinoscleromatis]
MLFLRQTQKNVKISIAIRLFLLNAFLVLSLVTLSQNITQKYGLFPVWLVLAAIVLFAVTLVPTVKFVRKHLTVGKSRAVILSSFLIVYAVRFNGVFSDVNGGGYTLNGYNVVWTLFFLFASLLAYIGCSGSKHILVILHRHLHRNLIILNRLKSMKHNLKLTTILL